MGQTSNLINCYVEIMDFELTKFAELIVIVRQKSHILLAIIAPNVLLLLRYCPEYNVVRSTPPMLVADSVSFAFCCSSGIEGFRSYTLST